MNITCAICQDIFRPSDDIYSTQCGHTFHLVCIKNWFQKGKKSCPTCREPATDASAKCAYHIHRLYFDISRSSEIPVNVGVLQDELDNITFKLKTKEKELRTLKEGYDECDKQNKGLKLEIRTMESNLEKNKELIYVYKEQLKGLKILEEDNAKLKKQLISLNNTMEHMQNVKDLLTGSFAEVDSMLKNQYDPKTLQIYCSTLKKHFEDHVIKFRKEREKTKRLQQEVVDLTKQRDKLMSKCEHYMNMLDNHQSQSKRTPEQSEDHDYVQNVSSKIKLSPSSVPKKAEKHKSRVSSEENMENCTPKKQRRRTIVLDSDLDTPDKNTVTKKLTKEKEENKTSSPYLQAKGGVTSLKFNFLKRNCSSASESALFAKKPRLFSQPKKTQLPFDGMGGRSRDVEPSESPQKLKLKRSSECSVKPKKARLGEKLRTLDDFVDLTSTP